MQQQEQTTADAPEEQAEPKQAPPIYLGSVHQVYSERQFALLRIIGPMPQEGAVLISHPFDGTADRIGNLRVASGQHSRNGIIAADIRSGIVMKGDRIFQYRNILSNEADDTTTESSEIPVFEGLEQDIEMPQESMPTDHTSDYGVSRFNEARTSQQNVIPEEPALDPAPQETFPAATPEPPTFNENPTPNHTPGSNIMDIPDTIDGWDNM